MTVESAVESVRSAVPHTLRTRTSASSISSAMSSSLEPASPKTTSAPQTTPQPRGRGRPPNSVRLAAAAAAAANGGTDAAFSGSGRKKKAPVAATVSDGTVPSSTKRRKLSAAQTVTPDGVAVDEAAASFSHQQAVVMLRDGSRPPPDLLPIDAIFTPDFVAYHGEREKHAVAVEAELHSLRAQVDHMRQLAQQSRSAHETLQRHYDEKQAKFTAWTDYSKQVTEGLVPVLRRLEIHYPQLSYSLPASMLQTPQSDATPSPLYTPLPLYDDDDDVDNDNNNDAAMKNSTMERSQQDCASTAKQQQHHEGATVLLSAVSRKLHAATTGSHPDVYGAAMGDQASEAIPPTTAPTPHRFAVQDEHAVSAAAAGQMGHGTVSVCMAPVNTADDVCDYLKKVRWRLMAEANPVV